MLFNVSFAGSVAGFRASRGGVALASTSSARCRALVLLAAVALVAPGCGDDAGSGGSTGTGGSSGGAGGSGGSAGGAGGSGGGSGGTGGVGPVCDSGPGYEGAPDVRAINTVNGEVNDLNGDPVANVPVLLCGIDICLDPVTTNASGTVVIAGNGQMVDTPKFKVGNGLNYGKYAYDVPDAATINISAVLPALSNSGQAMDPGAEISHQGATLTLAADAEVDIDILTYTEPSDQTLKVAEIPAASITDLSPASLNLEIMFAFGPSDTKFCPSAQLTVPNSAGWEAGAQVEFLIHGLSILEEWAPYGGWAVVSGGVVSDDGTTVSTNVGEGIPELTNVGVRLAQ